MCYPPLFVWTCICVWCQIRWRYYQLGGRRDLLFKKGSYEIVNSIMSNIYIRATYCHIVTYWLRHNKTGNIEF